MCRVRASLCQYESSNHLFIGNVGRWGTLMIPCWAGSENCHRLSGYAIGGVSKSLTLFSSPLDAIQAGRLSLNDLRFCEGLQPVTSDVEGAGTGGNGSPCKPLACPQHL